MTATLHHPTMTNSRCNRTVTLPRGARRELGRELRRARVAIGLSVTGLALRTGYAVPWLMSVEGGARSLMRSQLARLAGALGSSADHLVELALAEQGRRGVLPRQGPSEALLTAWWNSRGVQCAFPPAENAAQAELAAAGEQGRDSGAEPGPDELPVFPTAEQTEQH